MSRPEDEARVQIDARLRAAGWEIQDRAELNVLAGLGVAVREFPLKTGHGFADYLLYVNGNPVGVVEAKKEGATLTGVEVQTTKYIEGLPDDLDTLGILPFVYQSTGVETRFTNLLDPDAASREVWAFHRPDALLRWATAALAPGEDTLPPTQRTLLAAAPPLDERGMRTVQIDAVKALETSMLAGRRRALIQMATGAGKTYTAVASAYRLLKHAKAERILFLVDRTNLGIQAEKEFAAYRAPDDGRLFGELYNVQLLRSNKIDPVAKVVITTIQRLYSMLRGEAELDPELEEGSRFDGAVPERPVEIAYNPAIPIEHFDVVFVDEAHRSIYTLWRPVLEYFDANLIGLTATPNKHTYGFFRGNVVMEYTHERAVADGVNVPFGVYEIRTQLSQDGVTVNAGEYVYKRDRLTRAKRWEQADESQAFTAAALNRDVVAPDQIRTVIRTFREKVVTEIFPGRTETPKTLIFAVSDSHADDIVQAVRDEFGKGNDFCQKITYRTTGEKPETLLQRFRNDYYPRVVVTVDMIATGTDVKPIEIVMFMRMVKSRGYFDQMKGRGVRVIPTDDLRHVTPSAGAKTHFMIVDCVGIAESELNDTAPLEREPSVNLEKLLERVAMGSTNEDTLSTLVNRFAKLDKKLTDAQRAEIQQVSGGHTLTSLAGRIIHALDPDEIQLAAGAAAPAGEEPTPALLLATAKALAREAVKPLAANAKLRDTIVRLKQKADQIIAEHAIDKLTHAGPVSTEWAQTTIQNFEQFLTQHKDDYDALRVLYSRPRSGAAGTTRLRFQDIKQLATALADARPALPPESVWRAYETLEKDRVRGAGTTRLITDVVSLVRFALKEEDELAPFPERVAARYEAWLATQEAAGRQFTREQKEWLAAIRDYVATSAEMTEDAFDDTPFTERGGLARASRVFGPELTRVVEEMNEVLAG